MSEQTEPEPLRPAATRSRTLTIAVRVLALLPLLLPLPLYLFELLWIGPLDHAAWEQCRSFTCPAATHWEHLAWMLVLGPSLLVVLCHLVDQHADLRGQAIFALGYWAGCRVSDVSHLRLSQTHVGPKLGWLRVGHKGEKFREIDLLNEAHRPLHLYLLHGGRDESSTYVFTFQRSPHLTEYGIHQWFRTLKQQATKDQWALIGDVTFHDLRHDFAHRAREAGWSLEEIAYYLGHVTKKGTPAIQTTARYTQVSREQVKEKLRSIKG